MLLMSSVWIPQYFDLILLSIVSAAIFLYNKPEFENIFLKNTSAMVQPLLVNLVLTTFFYGGLLKCLTFPLLTSPFCAFLSRVSQEEYHSHVCQGHQPTAS